MDQATVDSFRDMPEDEVRKILEAEYGEGNVWNTKELMENFTLESFLAPWCFGIRKSDGAKISLTFIHEPRFYFDCRERS